jgi:hypothetical protein
MAPSVVGGRESSQASGRLVEPHIASAYAEPRSRHGSHDRVEHRYSWLRWDDDNSHYYGPGSVGDYVVNGVDAYVR